MSLALRFLDQKSQSYFLFGPRGTGKSTWLKEMYPNAARIDLLDTAQQRQYLAFPERLRDFVAANNKCSTIVIDEVQRVPQMLSIVHLLMEEQKDLQFILTGSSARKLRQGGVDLLGGRALERHMHPFMATEIGSIFDLSRAIRFGMIPLVLMSQSPEATIKGYIDLYIDQEIKVEGIIRKLDVFSRFLEVLTFSHGQLLNAASVARDCMASRNTVESYVAILESLLVAVRIPVFTKRAKRKLVTHNKFYFFDCGVYNALRPRGPLDQPSEIGGSAVEGLVMQHLRAWIDYFDKGIKLFFWRTLSGTEVDFVLYGDNVFYAIEVKNSTQIRSEDLKSLKSFSEDYPEAKLIFLYRGSEKIFRDNILCFPLDIFLKSLSPKSAFPY